jgi:prepilin-type N-terminal cleavage/methylation domain-containing protein
MRSRDPRARRGFTLLELLVALTVGLAAIAMVRSQVADLIGIARALPDRSWRSDSVANAPRLLRDVLTHADGLVDTTKRIRGDSVALLLMAWCPTADMLPQACSASLVLDTRAPRATLALRVQGRTLAAIPAARDAALLYLTDVEPTRRWVERWPASVAPPRAVALVAGGDTVVFPIGPVR